MIICIIGSGGREHAICKTISLSSKISKIYCMPGNAGTQQLAENIDLDINNFEKVLKFLKDSKVDLVIVGPEKPLVNGIVDYLESNDIKVFGPRKIPSQLEGSKTFTKNICKKYNIPTAKFGIFEKKENTINFLKNSKFPIVIKADGLAAGKGVYISKNLSEAKEAVNEIFDGKFGVAKKILVEEFLNGEEMSFFIVCDGKNFKIFKTAQDHKRVNEGDEGKNTGGMGAYSPSGLINTILENKIIDKIISPTLKAIEEMGEKYKGFLYAGLMILDNEPFLIEYNVRMGDPECQTILPLLKTDLIDVCNACCDENLESLNIEWKEEKSLCIVLCSKGYPEKFTNNVKIDNLNNLKLNNNDFIFHAGTKEEENEIFSNGGRVLNFVSLSSSFKNSRERAIKLIDQLNWKNGFFRKDIGFKIIDK
ncbi:MAG: phosphoribosylamine--glycine ligase [Pelagibacterales bacterium]|nr:phosphoribosylamine--glycine ligase [Pelagibacterales bacterium]